MRFREGDGFGGNPNIKMLFKKKCVLCIDVYKINNSDFRFL